MNDLKKYVLRLCSYVLSGTILYLWSDTMCLWKRVCDACRHLLLTKLHVLVLRSSHWMYLHDHHMPCVSYIINIAGGHFASSGKWGESAPDREQEQSKETILDPVSGYCLAWRWYLELLQALIANLKRKPTFLRQGNLRPWGHLEPLSPSVLKTLLWWLHVIGENSIFVVTLVEYNFFCYL